MDNELAEATPTEPVQPASHLVHSVMHFLRVVRYRKDVVLAAMVVAFLLGSLYYATATRVYQSKASLLILQAGGEVNTPSMSAEGSKREIMPTYQRLIKSAVVLRGAIRNLHPKHRVDLSSIPQDKWVETLANNLSAAAVRRTNIIEVSYRSKDAESAAAVIRAVIESYLDFIDKTHRGTAGEIIRVLTKEKGDLEETLQDKQQKLLAARRMFGDLGLERGGHIVHPLVQRAIRLNEALIEAQEKRIEHQSFLASLQAAVRNGEDLQQHTMAAEAAVGREILLTGLGFNSQDADVQAKLERTLLDDRATLQTLSRGLGPNHPKVVGVQERIHLTEQYLRGYHTKVTRRLTELRDRQLGPMLTQMLQQAVAKAWSHENSLRHSYDQARTEAIQLNGDLAQLEILEHDVKRLRDFHDVMVNRIANIDLRQEHGDIRATVVEEPVPLKRPVSPRLSIVVIACLFSSLAVGGAVVYVLDILDDRFRSPEELQAHLGVPVLALVRKLEIDEASGLAGVQTNVAPDASQSEAFRTLRTAIAFSTHDSERVVVSSSEPGDGKTTILVNLAVSLAQSGKKTLLIDADLRRPGLTALVGMKTMDGLTDILRSDKDILELTARHVCSTDVEHLDVLPSGIRRPNPAELLAGPNFADLLAWADTIYDQILIDSPPVLAVSDAQMIGRLVDGVVLVVNSEKNRRHAVVRTVESFAKFGVHVFGVVANRVMIGDGYGYGYGYGYEYGQDADELDDMKSHSADALTGDFAATNEKAPLEGIVPRRVA